MSDERHKPYSAVYLFLRDGDEILLLQRRNTGHRDGEYGLVAGHIDDGESATEAMVREAREEVGIEVSPAELDPVHVIHRRAADRTYVDLFFEAETWDGTVENCEPDKCGELRWVERDALPADTIPYVRQALERETTFSEFGW